MNFFTQLLTPVFVVLGMFSTPVEMPVEVQPDVQQEVLELQQKVQEFENQKSENEEGVELEEKVNESKALEVKKESVKITPVQEPQKEIKSIDSKLIEPIPSIVEIPTNEYKVVSVVDGDTIKLNIKGTVETIRLIGIDTPETVHPSKPVECMGMEASNKAKELLLGKMVRFETDNTQDTRDRFGRLLGYVFLPEGTNFGEVMIRSGFANEYTYSKPYKYQEAFKTAEQIARNDRVGLWKDGVCDEYNAKEPLVDPQPTKPSVSVDKKWYVSSHHSSKFYYCEDTNAWEGLSKSYLEIYDSEAELRSKYPTHTLHESCK